MRALLLAGVVALGWVGTSAAGPLVSAPSAGTTIYTSAAAFTAATTGDTTIGFDGIIVAPATYTGLPNQPRGGVTFQNGDPNVGINVTSKNFYSPSFSYPNDFIVDASSSDSSNTLTLRVATGTRAIAINFGALFSSAASLVTLSNGTTVIDSATANNGGTEFLGFTSNSPITTLSLTITGDSYVLEDAILAAPVPEPASLALLALPLGAAGLVVARRRRTA